MQDHLDILDILNPFLVKSLTPKVTQITMISEFQLILMVTSPVARILDMDSKAQIIKKERTKLFLLGLFVFKLLK